MITIVFFEVEGDHVNLTGRVIDAVGAGMMKEFGKKKVFIGKPKDRSKLPADAVVLSPYEIKTKQVREPGE